MKSILGIAPLALLLLSVGSASAADPTSLEMSGDKVHIGTGVICDTQDEVTHFVRLMAEHDAGGAMQTVNRTASNPLACGMATVAFRAGADLGEIRNGKGSYKILKIEVIAGTADGNWHMLAPRRTQFTAIAIPGLDI
jgi:hypothetical protein